MGKMENLLAFLKFQIQIKTGMNYLLCDEERWCCEEYLEEWPVFLWSASDEWSLRANWRDANELLLSVSCLCSGRRSAKRGSVGLSVIRGSLGQSRGISLGTGCCHEGPPLGWGRDVEAELVSMGLAGVSTMLCLLTGGWERLRDSVSLLRIFLVSLWKSRSCVLIMLPRLPASSINAPQSLCSCGNTFRWKTHNGDFCRGWSRVYWRVRYPECA